ncbi:unknown [Clostridium sp. CAG:1000]|jgi:hypothetical protein|nr:unknown [Clostridium sp. CAG:1000]
MKNNKLKVTIEDGSEVTVNVLDIIDSLEFNKTFMIYTVNDNDENIFASILNEKEETFSLDTITDNKEIEYINSEIDRIVGE